jgi:D-alanyl-D-alanine carboxypeptidase (penicillin-binding protein 5/6)
MIRIKTYCLNMDGKTLRILNPVLALTLLLFSSLSAAALPLPSAPPVSAKSYILIDFQSGHLLAQKDSNARMEPASITKLMTAYVVFGELKAGRLKLTDKVLISKKAWRMPGSRTFVEVNSKVPVETLLKGIIIQSGNDATVALAEHVAGSEQTFAALMNQYAQQLGMKGSHFVNSTGLPHAEHYSTARDLATLAYAVIRDYPEYYKYYSMKKFVYNGIPQYNRNKLLWRDKSVDGIKTGHTDSAGYCLISSAKRDNMRLISVVLGDKSEEARAVSSKALLSYGFRFFETRKLYSAGQVLKKVRIWKGEQEMLPLGLTRDLYVTFRRGNYKKLRATVNVESKIIAPAKKFQKFGTLNISLDNTVITDRPLVALKAVPQGGLWGRMTDSIKLWFK